METSLRVRNGDLQSSSQPCSDTAHKSAQTVAKTQLRYSSSMGQRSSSDAQLTSEADIDVHTYFSNFHVIHVHHNHIFLLVLTIFNEFWIIDDEMNLMQLLQIMSINP